MFPILQKVPMGFGSICSLLVTVVVLCTQVIDAKSDSLLRFGLHGLINFFARCGVYLYSIYVWHSVLAKADQVFFHIPIGPYHLLFLLMALPLASLSYKFIEKPILQHKITMLQEKFNE